MRLGLIENTKKNAEAVLRVLAAKLASTHDMRLEIQWMEVLKASGARPY